MQKLTRIQKYELERNRLEDIAKTVNAKKKEITFSKTYRTGPTPERPADKCVAWTFLEYESDCDWESLYARSPASNIVRNMNMDAKTKNAQHIKNIWIIWRQRNILKTKVTN